MKYLIGTALAILIAAPAAAQSAGAIQSSGRVEARFGWDRGEFKTELRDPLVDISDKNGKSGVTYGIEAGYDYVTDSRFLVGGYVGVEGSSIKDCATTPFGERDCLKGGRNFTVGARAGYVTDQGVVYLKGGYSNGQLKFEAEDFVDDERVRFKDNHGGFHLGAGGEVMVTNNVYGKLEYVFTNYSSDKFDDGITYAKFRPQRHQLVAGIGLRF
ncbi:outer membrane beta-barrel protein [Sphingomonas sp.]|jgi:outer membrane immunogenic protein|uniref:outer membrane protein n=1 Tax=Sphingomonas sp. TaxID=28214 RepID=UPI00262114A9|nr:outer membrane beta-barrel protein [Sphingomonas sp.]MDF2605762.1 putative outer membrane protein [Sphingomonas sp.]